MKRFQIKPRKGGGWTVKDTKHGLAGECDSMHEVFMMCRTWHINLSGLLHPDRRVRKRSEEYIQGVRDQQ